MFARQSRGFTLIASGGHRQELHSFHLSKNVFIFRPSSSSECRWAFPVLQQPTVTWTVVFTSRISKTRARITEFEAAKARCKAKLAVLLFIHKNNRTANSHTRKWHPSRRGLMGNRSFDGRSGAGASSKRDCNGRWQSMWENQSCCSNSIQSIISQRYTHNRSSSSS